MADDMDTRCSNVRPGAALGEHCARSGNAAQTARRRSGHTTPGTRRVASPYSRAPRCAPAQRGLSGWRSQARCLSDRESIGESASVLLVPVGPQHGLVRITGTRWSARISVNDEWPRICVSWIGFIPLVICPSVNKCPSRSGLTPFDVPAVSPRSGSSGPHQGRQRLVVAPSSL